MKSYPYPRILLILISFVVFGFRLNATVYNISASNTISVTSGYINNMEDVWNVTGSITNKPLAVHYTINIEQYYDNVQIYEVDANNNATLKTTLTGSKAGIVYLSNPTGKAKVVFITDGSVSYSPPYYTGITISFSYHDIDLFSNSAAFNTVRGTLAGGALRIKTDFGSLDLGAQNASGAHINTDRSKIVFDKPIYSMTGEFSTFNNSNLSLQTNGTTRVSVLNSNGNVGIGTNWPVNNFEVVNSSSNVLEVAGFYNTYPYSNSNRAETRINLGKIEGTNRQPMGAIGAFPLSNYDSSNGLLLFYTRNSQNMIERLRIDHNGNFGMGTSEIPVGYKLAVAGKIIAEEVMIKLQSSGWPDYVFKQNYNLMPICEVESYVKANHHLPGIPCATTVENEGISMGEMQTKLLQKIEELTLYIIHQEKRIKILEENIIIE